MKVVTGEALDKVIKQHIRYSDKAPRNWAQRRQIIRETGTDLAVGLRKRGIKLPWALIIIIGVVLVAVILFIIFRDKGKYGEGKDLDEPVNIRGKDEEQLKDLFGYKGQGQKEPGRPFDQNP